MNMSININDVSDKKELEALLKLAQALLGKVEENKVDIEYKPINKHKCTMKRKLNTVRTARSKYWDVLADMPEVVGVDGVFRFLQENGRLDYLPKCVKKALSCGDIGRAKRLWSSLLCHLLRAQCPCIKRGSQPNTFVGNLTQYGQKITNIFC